MYKGMFYCELDQIFWYIIMFNELQNIFNIFLHLSSKKRHRKICELHLMPNIRINERRSFMQIQ